MSSPLSTPERPPAGSPHPGMGFREFVLFIAGLMATNAIAIDSMLPALPEIGESLGIDTANHTQLVITAYLLGFGGAQLVYGTLADRFGRRGVLLFGLAVYTLASIGAVFAGTLGVMLAARVPRPRRWASPPCGCCRAWARRRRAFSPSPSCATAIPARTWRG